MKVMFLVVALTLPGAGAAAESFETLRKKAVDAYKAKDYQTSVQHLRAAVAVAAPAEKPTISYHLAALEAKLGQRQAAMATLTEAVSLGFSDWQRASVDPDLAPLRKGPAWGKLQAAMKARSATERIFEVTRWENPDLGWASLHRFDAWDGARSKELRERYKLLDVIADKGSELHKQLALMAWVHARWRHDGWNEPSKPDALTILAEAAQGKHFRCVEYSTTLAQVLQAVGFPARRIGLRRDGVSYGYGKGHVVTEAWNNDLGKWILLDGQNNATWQEGDRLLDAAEVRERFLGGKTAQLRFVNHGSPWMDAWQPEARRAEWVMYFDHLSYDLNQRRFDRQKDEPDADVELIRPGERHELLFQGWPQRNHAQTSEVGRIYPAFNQVHIDTGTSGDKGAIEGAITATLSHSAPWFDHYQISDNGKLIDHTTGPFRWSLRPGPNSLVVRAVNRAGVMGPPARLEVTYHPPR